MYHLSPLDEDRNDGYPHYTAKLPGIAENYRRLPELMSFHVTKRCQAQRRQDQAQADSTHYGGNNNFPVLDAPPLAEKIRNEAPNMTSPKKVIHLGA